eukprot:7841868-Karenia_brevis.AAC.1
MQWIMASEELSEPLRTEALLPSKLTDVDSGMCLPKWHCVFEGCSACAETKTHSEMSHEKGIWQHIRNDKKHKLMLIKVMLKYSLQQHFKIQEYVASSLVSEAIAVRERKHIPWVVASVDRRAL